MKKPAPRPTVNAPHEVRIIGGLWKRSKLPVADRPGLRPTPARVRETLFNWLGQDLRGFRCLDAFAGTGALGLEAASRGATEVVLVEQDPVLARGLNAVRERLKADTVRVERGDGVAALLQRRGQGLDLVFLDPPFGEGNAELYLSALRAARQCVRDEGFIYLEAPRAWSGDELAQLGLQVHREGQAGAVAFHLLRLLPAQ
ncbi:MAG: 16S rRNA (guanine(966)-N(2))-methyltransferase RsmD [Hydrogenophaga sp.]|uniref:16S rRNA (guanine(966)-N(2))-methyltransferase RsmD n=1 Tax=Hydrogenophaga sp. TaxID=1904254 RepID=UPI0025C29675|nr:16S rRNA (guanine(966)-N(2))-methyltransferase RsmD [Hydrogenophaga sp.]MBT9553642.1 16S rRNA (guanine(966)-N(2))-methyltransferase RsmD [Hydrogenophaga sp.]